MHELPNIAELIDDHLLRQAGMGGRRRAHSLHASSIGHPCERYLVYDQVTEAQTTEDPNLRLQRIFAVGRLFGEQTVLDVIQALRGTKYELSKVERSIPHNPYGIGGREDLAVAWRDDDGLRQEMPIEAKSCSPFVFDSIRTIEDMRFHKWPHIRKYPAQLMIYMHFAKADVGAFLLRNKSTGEYRWIPMAYDGVLADALLEKAERVTDAVTAYRSAEGEEAKGATLPERIQFDPHTCDGCEFRSQCIPDMSMAPGVTVLWESELEGWCRIREQTEDAHKAWKEADEKIKAHGKGITAEAKAGETRVTITESFEVVAKKGTSTSYRVPEEVRNKYVHKGDSCRTVVKRINEDEE
jgi:hypothetical protein